MQRNFQRFSCLLARAAPFVAAFATSATLLLAVGGAFRSVSSEPMLADSPNARLAVAGCDVLGNRIEQQRCVQRLVAEAKARDAGAAQVVVFAASQSGTRQ